MNRLCSVLVAALAAAGCSAAGGPSTSESQADSLGGKTDEVDDERCEPSGEPGAPTACADHRTEQGCIDGSDCTWHAACGTCADAGTDALIVCDLCGEVTGQSSCETALEGRCHWAGRCNRCVAREVDPLEACGGCEILTNEQSCQGDHDAGGCHWAWRCNECVSSQVDPLEACGGCRAITNRQSCEGDHDAGGCQWYSDCGLCERADLSPSHACGCEVIRGEDQCGSSGCKWHPCPHEELCTDPGMSTLDVCGCRP